MPADRHRAKKYHQLSITCLFNDEPCRSYVTHRPGGRLGDLGEQVTSGRMPPQKYILLHPNANLTDTEKQQLIDGLMASLSPNNQ